MAARDVQMWAVADKHSEIIAAYRLHLHAMNHAARIGGRVTRVTVSEVQDD